MTTIIERPHDFSFAENDIRYVFNVSDPTVPGCAVDIEIHYLPVSEVTDHLLITVSPVPDADGNIFFYLDDYLKSILQVQMPDPSISGVIQPVVDQVKYFYVRYREISTAEPSPDWIDDKPYKKVVLMGGVEQMEFERNNFFANYLPLVKPFMTWQPNNKSVFTDQEHYLTYLHTTGEANFTVEVITTFTDKTTSTLSFAYTVQKDFIFRIMAGANALQLHLIDPAKTLYYYDIRVVSGGNTLANPFRFYINYDYFYHWKDFNYINSLGGIDCVRLKGDFLWTVDTTSDDIERVKANKAFGSAFPVIQFGQTNIVKRDLYKGDIGWSKTPLQQEVLIELMMSKGIFEKRNGRWIGVINLKKSLDLRSNSDKKWSFPLEWSYGFADGVFTPKGISIGRGSAYVAPPVVCIAVGLPSGLAMPDAVAGVPYTFSFDVTGTAPFTYSAVPPAAWMNIAMSGRTVSFSGTPDAEVTGLAVSVTINNCSTSTIVFADTIDVAPHAASPSGKYLSIMNESNTAIQITSDTTMLYPSVGPQLNGSFTIQTNGSFVINAGSGVYTIECFTSYGSGYTSIYTQNSVNVGDQVSIPDLANTNYIRISKS